MFKSFSQQGLVKNVVFMGTILTTTFNVHAAEAVKDTTDLAQNQTSSEVTKKKPVPYRAGSGAEQRRRDDRHRAVAEIKNPARKPPSPPPICRKKAAMISAPSCAMNR